MGRLQIWGSFFEMAEIFFGFNLDQDIEQTKKKHQKSSGGITGYSITLGMVQRWVLTSHIITHCELQLEEGVLANLHSRTKDTGKSRMNFDKSCVDLLQSYHSFFRKKIKVI